MTAASAFVKTSRTCVATVHAPFAVNAPGVVVCAMTTSVMNASECVRTAMILYVRRVSLRVMIAAKNIVETALKKTCAQLVRRNGMKLRNQKYGRRQQVRKRRRPRLRFTPYAWAKLLYLRDAGDTEVGAFGIVSRTDRSLVEDVRLVRQTCSPVTVKFDDVAVADFFDEQIDGGRTPEQFARIWLHTHPGDSAEPSFVDEETFERCFGSVDWAVMFILARGGQTYSRLRYNVGPGLATRMSVDVDYGVEFPGSDVAGWQQEYEDSVEIESYPAPSPTGNGGLVAAADAFACVEEAHHSAEWLQRFDDSALMDFREEGRCLTKSLV